MNLEAIKKNLGGSIMKFAIPSVIGMLLTSLITIVDGFFIGNHVGKEGLAAINLGLPILYVFLGIAIMIGVGGSTIAIQRLGAKELEKANNVFNQTIITLVGIVIGMSLIASLLLNPITHFLNNYSLIRVHFKDYYRIMLMVYPVMMVNIVFGMFIRGENKPQVFMIISILTNISNIVLDYLFISRFNMGVRGAAFASAISVLLGLMVVLGYFMNRSKFKFSKYQFSKTDMKMTFFNGSSELIGQVSMAITLGLYNAVILNVLGVLGVAAMTIIGYAGYIYSMIVIGIGQGMSPMTSFVFGAQDQGLVMTIRKLTQKIVFVCGVFVFIIIVLLANPYARMFSNNIELQSMVTKGIRLYAFSFLIMGYNVIASFFFTSIGKAKESAIISSMRGLIILSICILILPVLLKDNGIWLVAPVTELITFGIAFSLTKGMNKKID